MSLLLALVDAGSPDLISVIYQFFRGRGRGRRR